MDFDILFLNAKKNSPTKNLILKLIILHNALTTTQIQTLLRTQYSRKISYQAIRQSLLELVNESILEKQEKEYRIRESWFEKIQYETSLIEKSLRNRDAIKILDDTTSHVSLSSLYELGHFILYSLEQKYFDLSTSKETYMVLDHLWIPFADPNKRQRLKELMKKNNISVFVNSKSTLDTMLSKWYKKFVKVKLATSLPFPNECIIHGDTVIQIYFNSQLKKQINKLYSLRGLAMYTLFNEFSDITYAKHKIEITITKNKLIADQMRSTLRLP